MFSLYSFSSCLQDVYFRVFTGYIQGVFWKYHSVEKSVKSFSKGTFLSHFVYFSILLQIIHRMPNIHNFSTVFDIGSLIKTYAAMYWYFITSTFLKLDLLINFYFLGLLLHYPIFLLPMDEFIANNKQAWVICISSR